MRLQLLNKENAVVLDDDDVLVLGLTYDERMAVLMAVSHYVSRRLPMNDNMMRDCERVLEKIGKLRCSAWGCSYCDSEEAEYERSRKYDGDDAV
jgi:hypothetical protein